jgi:ribosomal subunit interface protein
MATADGSDAELFMRRRLGAAHLDAMGRRPPTRLPRWAAGPKYCRAGPTGVDATGSGRLGRDVRECLLVQLAVRGETERLAARLISDHFADLQPHKLPHLSKQIGVDVDALMAELQFIRTLDPYPGRRYSSEEPVLIAPEIYIEKLDADDDEYVIYFGDDGSPRLRLSPQYQQMLGQQGVSNETKSFIREKMRSAVDLLRNIEHRRQTIYKVVESMVHRQKDFLDHGVQHLKPMMLKDIAEDIGMHLSTVSRVVNRKYAHTPQGVIELRRFFTEGMMNEDGEVPRIIKLKIKKLIKKKITINYDDQVSRFGKGGIKLSRRTWQNTMNQMRSGRAKGCCNLIPRQFENLVESVLVILRFLTVALFESKREDLVDEIRIHRRHARTAAIHEQRRGSFQRMAYIFNNSAGAHMIIEVEKNRHIGEIIVHLRDHTLTAKDINVDMYMALTRAISKIEKQALRLKKKSIARKQGAKRAAAGAPADRDLEASPRPARIIAARRYSVKPMTAEEAALRLTGEPDQFLVFRDADTARLGVLYKRNDGNFGLIEP